MLCVLIAAQCETKLKTAALVHNTFIVVGRIGGFFFTASCTALVTRYSPEARENSTGTTRQSFLQNTGFIAKAKQLCCR